MAQSVYILNDKGNIPDLAGQAQHKKLRSFLYSVHGFCTNAQGKDDRQHLYAVHYTRKGDLMTMQCSDGTKVLALQFFGPYAHNIVRALIERQVREFCVGSPDLVTYALSKFEEGEVTVPFKGALNNRPMNSAMLTDFYKVHGGYTVHYPDVFDVFFKDMTPEKFSLQPASGARFDPTALYRVTDFISKWFGTQDMGYFYTITPEADDPRAPHICNVTIGELMFCPENGARMVAGIMPLPGGYQEQNYSGGKRETVAAIIEAISNSQK